MSASSITTRAFFDPISNCTRVKLPAAATAIPRPTGTEPVKLMASMWGLSISCWPTLRPEPITKLNVPAGKPWREMMSVRATADAGTRLAGFQITALPNAKAGAIFQAAVAVGKFQGDTIATTPTASRRTSTSTPSRTESALSPIWRNTSAA